MKKFFVAVLVLAAVVVGGAGIFIATFDVNHYKPQMTQALEKTLGSPVRIGALKLGWSDGIAFQVNQLAIYSDRQSMQKAAATLDQASLRVRLAPLLRKKLDVISVVLVRPKLNIIKETDGSIHVYGLNPPAAGQRPAAAVAPENAASSFLQSFSIGLIRLEGAEVGFVDRSPQSVLKKITLKDVNVRIKNLSFTSPVDFEAKFSLFSGSQNLSLKGRLLVPSPQGPYTLQGFRLSSDLGAIRLSELSEAVPSLKNSGLVEPLQGSLNGEVDRLVVGPKGLGDLKAAVTLKNGRFQTQSLKSVFDDVAVEAGLTQSDLNLEKFSANFAKGTLTAQAVSRNYLSVAPRTHVVLTADQLRLEEVMPAPKPGRPQLQGKLSMNFNGDAEGLSWSSISGTLNGSGRVVLTDGVVVNLNLLKTIFDKLSKVPGVSDALNKYLSPAYREKLSVPYTVIGPFDFNVNVSNGRLVFPELRIISTGFQIVGAGSAGLNGSVDFQATLFLDPELSNLLLSTVPQMQYVANSQGLIAVPVKLKGTVQNLSVEPDMDFIFQKVLLEKGQKLVGDVLQKALTKTQDAAQTTGEQGGTTYKNILSKLLQ